MPVMADVEQLMEFAKGDITPGGVGALPLLSGK
jgi:hypothetical protein